MRGRSYSYSPSPPRSYRRRGRSPRPRGRHGGHSTDMPTSLLVRNLHHGCKPEDLRKPFGQFGQLKDIYLPRDYYTGEPRGFGFIQYVDPADAAEAKYQMDGQILLGRELTVVFAEENRKKPVDMRAREREEADAMTGDHPAMPICFGILALHAAVDPVPTAIVTIHLLQGSVATQALQGSIAIYLLQRSVVTRLLQGSGITRGLLHLMIKGSTGNVRTLVPLETTG